MEKKNININLIKLVACFIVIMTHCFLPYVSDNGTIDNSRLLIRGCLIDGVPLFLICTGYFYFIEKYSRTKYIKKLKKLLLLWGEVFIFVAVDLLIRSYIQKSWLISEVKDDFVYIINLQAGIHGAPHLWYMYLYTMIIVMYPVFMAIWEKKDAIIIIMILYVIALTYKSVEILFCYQSEHFTDYFTNNMYFFYLFVGALLYYFYNKKNERKLNNFMIVVISLLLWGVINFIRYKFTLFSANLCGDTSYNGYNTYLTLLGILSALFLWFSIYSININPKYYKIIHYVSSYTFEIYIIHYAVRNIIFNIGVADYFSKKCNTFILEFTYNIIIALIIFIICFLIVYLFKNIVRILLSLLHII